MCPRRCRRPRAPRTPWLENPSVLPVERISPRPFALVIVSGLITRLLISIYLMPVLYALVARPADRLEV